MLRVKKSKRSDRGACVFPTADWNHIFYNQRTTFFLLLTRLSAQLEISIRGDKSVSFLNGASLTIFMW